MNYSESWESPLYNHTCRWRHYIWSGSTFGGCSHRGFSRQTMSFEGGFDGYSSFLFFLLLLRSTNLLVGQVINKGQFDYHCANTDLCPQSMTLLRTNFLWSYHLPVSQFPNSGNLTHAAIKVDISSRRPQKKSVLWLSVRGARKAKGAGGVWSINLTVPR